MIDITSEKSIIRSFILDVLGKKNFTITLNNEPSLKVEAEDYRCDVWFDKDSSCDYPIIFIDKRGDEFIGKDWKIENFSWEKTFENLQHYLNYYVNLLKPFYFIECVEVIERSVYVDLSKIRIVYTFDKYKN
jgi:hypothetical protein